MADNCKICSKIISHTQYNVYNGFCSKCFENPYRDLDTLDNQIWLRLGSSCADGGVD